MEDPKLFSIKDFAEFSGTNQSTLRYYDDIGLLHPASRGSENNYRYYTPLQLQTIKFINILVNLGIPLATVGEMIKNRTPENMIDLLSRQETILDKKLFELQASYSIIHTFRKNIQNGLAGRAGATGIEILDEINYILGPVNDFGNGNDYYETFNQFCKKANDYRINLDYPIGGYHYDIDSFLNNPDRPDKYFSMDPVGNCTRRAGKYLVGYMRGHHGAGGYFGGFGEVPANMAAYAKEHELVFDGPVYVVFLFNEITTAKPEDYLSRVSVSVTDKNAKPTVYDYQKEKNCPIKQLCVKPHCKTPDDKKKPGAKRAGRSKYQI